VSLRSGCRIDRSTMKKGYPFNERRGPCSGVVESLGDRSDPCRAAEKKLLVKPPVSKKEKGELRKWGGERKKKGKGAGCVKGGQKKDEAEIS